MCKKNKKPIATLLKLLEFEVEVIQKDIKNIHLSVRPPDSQVRVSAPREMSLDYIRIFVHSKFDWIQRQQAIALTQAQAAPYKYTNGEIHYFKGEAYKLKIIATSGAARVALHQHDLTLHICSAAPITKRQAAIDTWYRHELKQEISNLIAKYEKPMRVSVNEFGVKKMKTRWGSCNPTAKRIWLNLELAKKTSECLEYVVLHEMAHLIERKHNRRFYALMSQYMPQWRGVNDKLMLTANL
jgi:hypothetical protein